MSLFERRSGGSSYRARDVKGLSKIKLWNKLNIAVHKFNSNRFSWLGSSKQLGELQNKMKGKFDITN